MSTNLLHPLQGLVQSVPDASEECDVAPDFSPWVTLSRQVQQTQPVEHQTRHHAAERSLHSLLCSIPLAAHLDLSLAVEHAQLVACQHSFVLRLALLLSSVVDGIFIAAWEIEA